MEISRGSSLNWKMWWESTERTWRNKKTWFVRWDFIFFIFASRVSSTFSQLQCRVQAINDLYLETLGLVPMDVDWGSYDGKDVVKRCVPAIVSTSMTLPTRFRSILRMLTLSRYLSGTLSICQRCIYHGIIRSSFPLTRPLTLSPWTRRTRQLPAEDALAIFQSS